MIVDVSNLPEDEQEYKERLKKNALYTEENFYKIYNHHSSIMSYIANCAKVYILDNYSKITDWSDLRISLYLGDGSKVEFFTHNPIKWRSEIMQKMSDRRAAKENPVKIFSAVLDVTDGDFSVTINGDDYLWIHEGAIIDIAHFIERQLLKDKL